MFTESQGKCIKVSHPTASAALKLCPKCSAERHQCEHCLATLGDKGGAVADAAPTGPLPGPALEGDSDNHNPPASAVPGDSPLNSSSNSGIPSAVPPG